ncbi:uncharacterized protein JCM6883_005018 [Sporobolomyces salmoneus]|uniref:uncharacterized protein n=1 Tax=Sporobolomyces salmoneus TaxID=183962 RepID=UPI0031781335
MSSKKQSDPERREGTSLLPSPPPYTALPASGSSSSSATAVNPSTDAPSPAPLSRPLVQFPQGPSPFASLPQPQASLYAHERQVQLRQADRRARRRFCAAMCWAGVIYLLLAMISGAVVGAALGAGAGNGAGDGHNHEHKHRKDRGDWDGNWLKSRKALPTSSTVGQPSQVYAII